MKLYRFSPIKTQDELFQAIKHIHFECYKLCKASFGDYLPNAGNVGVFCHYDDEYEQLLRIRDSLVKPSDNPDLKYYELVDPIIIPARGEIPETTYTHLYVRRPDPYRAQVGDVDFYLEQAVYDKQKSEMLAGKVVPGARVFERPDLDMIELFNPDVDALGYVSTHVMSEKVRIKLSDATKL